MGSAAVASRRRGTPRGTTTSFAAATALRLNNIKNNDHDHYHNHDKGEGDDLKSLLLEEKKKRQKRGKNKKKNTIFISCQLNHHFTIPLSILIMTVMVLLTLSYWKRINSTPGLYSAPLYTFTAPSDDSVRRTVCIDVEQSSVIRAFRSRNWNVVLLQRKSKNTKLHVMHCYRMGSASVVWTKLIPRYVLLFRHVECCHFCPAII